MDREILNISVSQNGVVRIKINGEPVGAVEQCELSAMASSTRVTLRLVRLSCAKCSSAGLKGILAMHSRIQELARNIPWMSIVETDTLPSGMPAVRVTDDAE